MFDPADDPQVVEIAPRVWVRVEVDSIAWIDMGGWAAVIDAHEDAAVEGELFGAMAATLGETPITTVINTHTHYDHIYFNDTFHQRFGAEIVNQETSPIPPEGRWIEGHGRRLLILPMVGCHTDEDVVIWLPDCKVLFVGDIFGWGLINLIGRLNAETVPDILAAYDRVIAMGAEIIVVGHGPTCTNAELVRWVEYFRWLHAEVLAAIDAGQGDQDIMHTIAPPDDMHDWWRFVQWKHEHSVDRMIKSIRDGWRIMPD